MPSAAGAVREASVITQRSITSIECQHSSYNYIHIIRVGVLLWQVLAVQPLVLQQPCVFGAELLKCSNDACTAWRRPVLPFLLTKKSLASSMTALKEAGAS